MTEGLVSRDYSVLVERYQRLRKISYGLHSSGLLKYLSKQAFPVGGKRLGMLGAENTLMFESEDHVSILADYCLYDLIEEGGTAISRYRADSHADPASEEYAVVRAMSEAFHTLVEVTEVLPGVGVRAADLLAGRREYLVVDMGLGRTAQEGGVLATRLFPVEDEFVMTSGAGLLVDAPTLREIRASVLPRYQTEENGQCPLAGGRQKAADRTAAIVRLCVGSRAADRVRYEDFDAGPAVAPVSTGPRVGRNDACPCGSGRKYKHCHGRSA
jgi:hypothetical protein